MKTFRTMKKKLISLISPCFNEELNINELYSRVSAVIDKLPEYDFEYVFIDNASTDKTIEKLKALLMDDTRIKLIINNRNFGHIRSPYWGLMQTKGDATIYLASDLQDPPELIPQFIQSWEKGYKLVMAVKPVTEGNRLMHFFRRSYYRMLAKISEVPLTNDTTGFGLYDSSVIEDIRKINDPYPYLRGLIDELGYPKKLIEFTQPRRVRGITKNNFYTLFDIAMLGIVSHSMLPLRISTFLGCIISGLSFLAVIFLVIAKLIWWSKFEVVLALVVLVIVCLLGVMMISIGLLGEYVGLLHTYAKNRPIVTEKERINF